MQPRWPGPRGSGDDRLRREAGQDQREAELDELAKTLGVALADLQRRTEETVARSDQRIARSMARMDREAAARQREQLAVQRKLLESQRAHAGIDRRHREVMAQTQAAIMHAKALRRPSPPGDTQR